MLRNYLLISFRQLYRHKTYSAINIIGFAIGLTACLLMAYYVVDEMTFDQYFEESENIYRLITYESESGKTGEEATSKYAITSGALIAKIKDDIPEIIGSARVNTLGNSDIGKYVESDETDDSTSLSARFVEADQDFFNIFSYNLLAGDITEAYENSGGVILTNELAEKIFGSIDPIGKPLRMSSIKDAFVAAVIEKPPHNTHLRFDFIRPLIITDDNRVWLESWENLFGFGYFKVLPGTDRAELFAKIEAIAEANNFADVFYPVLQPLNEIHFESRELIYDQGNAGKNELSRVNTVMIIAIMVLLTASINFINLATARSSKRSREVGIRKAIGAERSQLIFQYLTETIMMTVIAMLIAMMMVEILVPAINLFIDKDFDGSLMRNPLVLIAMSGIAVLVGIISGLYPTIVLAGFQPSKVLKGELSFSRHGVILRRILVVSQFAVPITMISCSLIVINQIDYLNHLDLGYSRDNIMVVTKLKEDVEVLFPEIKMELAHIPGIASVSTLSQIPGAGNNVIRYEVLYFKDGTTQTSQMFTAMRAGTEALNSLDIRLKQGRYFSIEFTSDIDSSVLINEAAVKVLGWDNPLGKNLTIIDVDGKEIHKQVVGVFKDFHLGNARNRIEPMMIWDGYYHDGNFVVAKLTGKENDTAIAGIKETLSKTLPEVKYLGYDLSDVFHNQFKSDRLFALGIEILAGVAGLIACLGLIGLVAYSIEQRRHSIAVRKVLGCDEIQIVMSLTGEIVKWVVVANIIAWPLGYLAMRKWLDGFVVQVPLSPMPFMFAGFTALTIAIVTISIQTLRAARTNPAICLRVET